MSQPAASTGRPNFLALHAESRPDRLSVIGPDRSLTYAELLQRGKALARALHARGLRPGDHVAVMTYNLPQRAEMGAAVGLLQASVIAVPYQMKPSEIEYIVENSGSRLLFFWHEFADRILPYRDRYPGLLPGGFICFGPETPAGAVDYESLFLDPPPLDFDALPPAKNPAQTMIYTSGTTGRPKGAARVLDTIDKPGLPEYLFALVSSLGLNADEVHLVCCPLYHSAPFFFSGITFILGGTRVLQPRFDAEQFLQLVDRHRVTSTHLVPTMVRRLLQVPAAVTDRLDLSSLRTVVCGAAPLHPDDKLRFLDRFGPILYEYYGSTEGGINTLITAAEMRQRPASVGRALPSNDLVILDQQGLPVPDGRPGVLYIYNPMMMDGYYQNQNATAEIFHGRHLTVGDVAVRDADGYYFIVDRVKDMIIRGGVNIYPAEIERVLNAMPGVADSAVVGRSDRELGETVAAFVVPEADAPLGAEAVIAHCKKEMADNKVPATITFVDEIPRTPTGKILKRVLRERLG
jgi:acyl-CoA synthetase (AMP-forming)/AMP-acid ligase II